MKKNIVILAVVLLVNTLLAKTDSTLKFIKVNSLTQKIVDLNKVILKGDVEIIVDDKIHIWADEVVLNKNNKTVKATTSVVLEQKDSLILADYVFLDLDKKIGHANNIRLHLKDGFLFAKKAEKISDHKWHFKNVSYTACDKPSPDWKISVSDVWMKKNTVYLYNIPLFKAPLLVGSGDDKSNSGFLLPRLSYSKRLGPGLIQEYYWDISDSFDTTIGVNWKEKKGFVLYDEFRHITGKDEFSLINMQYAQDKRAESNRDRFWLAGNHFHTLKLEEVDVNNLMRVDFGTDKRIGYDFFYSTDAVEDTFDNNFVSRIHLDKNVFSFSVDNEKTFRNKFFFENDNEFKQEDSFRVSHVPHLEWNSTNFPLSSNVYYKNDVFADQVFARKKSFDTSVTPSFESLPFDRSENARLYYQGTLASVININRNILTLKLTPNFQARNRLKNPDDTLARKNVLEKRMISKGAYRAFLKSGAELSLPELSYNTDKYVGYFQPTFKWNFTPKFKQSHWYNNDIWDREYAQNEISCELKHDLYFDNARLESLVSVGGEFYNNTDIFPLRRNPLRNHYLPCKLNLDLDMESFRASLNQEYDIEKFVLLDSKIDLGFTIFESEVYASLMYQNPKLQTSREFLSDIPSFANFGFRIPIGNVIKVSYDSNFYSPSNSFFGILKNSDALLHRIRLDYKGHCWGASFGYEEKRFRREGNVKSEQSYFISFKLDSIGAFAHHFRKEPEILKAPSDY